MNFETIVRHLKEAGLEPRSYSGRGMYGKECVGASSDSLFSLPEGLPSPQVDQLGKGLIFYWPSIAWKDVAEPMARPGPGKYDSETRGVLASTMAETVVLLVVNGRLGTGFSVTTANSEHISRLPEMLEDLAAQIRRGTT